MILVLGRAEPAAVIGQLLAQSKGEYWEDIASGVDRLKSAPHRFATIFAVRAEMGISQIEDALAGTDALPTLVWLDVMSLGEAIAEGAPSPVCAVRRTPDGGCHLHCALAEAQCRPERQPALAAAIGNRPVGFVYSAPVDPGTEKRK